MSARLQWEGRDVVFTEFNIATGREVRSAFAVDPERGSYVTLVKSARYADSNEPVFRSVDEIEALPFRLQQRVMRLAGEAAEANKQDELEVVDETGTKVPLS